MAISHRPVENRFVTSTDWQGYTFFLKAVGDGHTRVTYDRGTLELMTPSNEHEAIKSILGRLLETYMNHARIVYLNGGSTTFRKRKLARGLEPDECYWIANAGQLRGQRYDAKIHPPPDLVIEVDIWSSSIDRIDIYRTMRVPEVWVWSRAGRLSVRRLTESDSFETMDASPTFPDLPLEVVSEHVRLALQTTTAEAVWALQDWLQGRS